jgi:PadR family transcriptional regulator AphA
MARRSRTPLVILGLLTTRPMTGYDLKTTIDRSIGHFWSESYGQLYPALRALQDDGLVTVSEEAEGGRRKKLYAITDAGRGALREWLATPPAPRFVRNELLLRMFFGHQTPPEVLRGHLLREQGEARGLAAALATVREELSRESAGDPELPYWLITLDLGRRTALARAEWAAAALETLPKETS